jgi:hypothetical protein
MKQNCHLLKSRWILLVCLLTCCIIAKPMEPFDNTLVILVHGIAANYKNVDNSDGTDYCPIKDPGRPSNIFDHLPHAMEATFGDLKGFLDHELGLKGRVYY